VPARLTLHPPHRAARFLVLRDGETLQVGRDPESTLVIEDARVSKRHACLRGSDEGWTLDDVGSKNGTSVNGAPADGTLLRTGDWVSFGGVLGRFDVITQEAADELAAERLARLQTSVQMRRRLSGDLEPFDLLLRFLESAMELVGAQRGFVLLSGADGHLRVEVAAGFDADAAVSARFAGSLGAVERALKTGQTVVVTDVRADPRLGRRASVVSSGIGALACVPIREEGEILGLLYVDGAQRSTGFTELDVEILESLAGHASLAIASVRLERRLRELANVARPGMAGALDALQRRLGRALTGSSP
jgi:pSer/pThr/pTyr-binding forkhead associated (FHA) protein